MSFSASQKGKKGIGIVVFPRIFEAQMTCANTHYLGVLVGCDCSFKSKWVPAKSRLSGCGGWRPRRRLRCSGAAAVVSQPGVKLEPKNILATLKTMLANFKIPKGCYVVSELPRNTMGKVQKNLLRAQYANLL
jgi:hypothetical protein